MAEKGMTQRLRQEQLQLFAANRGISGLGYLRMAVEISSNGNFGESVRLSGADAESFVREIEHPSTDARRLGHLERSDDAYRRLYSPEPIHELPTNA